MIPVNKYVRHSGKVNASTHIACYVQLIVNRVWAMHRWAFVSYVGNAIWNWFNVSGHVNWHDFRSTGDRVVKGRKFDRRLTQRPSSAMFWESWFGIDIFAPKAIPNKIIGIFHTKVTPKKNSSASNILWTGWAFNPESTKDVSGILDSFGALC